MTILMQVLVAICLLAALGFFVTAPVAATVWLLTLLTRNGFLRAPKLPRRRS